MTWYAYIALLESGRFYVGIIHVHPNQRALRHQAGFGGSFTRRVKISRVLWFEVHPSSMSARKRGQQIKRWSHEKKQALIERDFGRLKSISRPRIR
jgi:putative endonuclease